VVAQVRGALGSGSQQLRLLDTGPVSAIPGPPQPGSRLGDWQRFQRAADAGQGTGSAVLLDFVHLASQLGGLGGTLARVWQDQERHLAQAGNQVEARGRALAAAAPEIEAGLAEALSYILQLANDAGINLEDAYLKRIKYR
jgi:hypothetical protein